MRVLVLEASTTSAKAMLFSTDEQDVQVRVEPFRQDHADPGVRDAESVLLQIAALGRTICDGQAVDVVVLSSTWHSLVVCDADMRPVTPAYEWPFTGAQEISGQRRADAGYARWFYERTGCMVNAIYPAFKLAYLRSQGVDLGQSLVLDQGTYGFFRLTGERLVMDSMASGSGLVNLHTGTYDDAILAETGIQEWQLPEVVSYTRTAPLTHAGAALLGLRAGIPVMTAAPDGGLSQIGDGALPEGVMTLSMGTSGAIRLSTAHPVLSDHMTTWAYRSPVSWLSGAATSGCCNCVDWAKDLFFPGGVSYDEIDAGLGRSSERTPVFLPFLFGERCPGWDDHRRGGFNSVEPQHTALDLYQSVLEGTLFNLYQCYIELSDLNGVPARIKLSGGVLNSAHWTQMCADVFGVDLEVSPLQHSSLVGGAMLGLRLIGDDGDHPTLAPDSTRRVVADPAMATRYAEKYERYLCVYAQCDSVD
ncbi:MAG: gluconokinase [Cellulomonas sp.]